jgi:predicted nucleotidyltransferase
MPQSYDSSDLIRRLRILLGSVGLKHCILFGSFARGEEDDASDIDILIIDRGAANHSDLITIKGVIEITFGRKADLVDIGSLPERVRVTALAEGVPLLVDIAE